MSVYHTIPERICALRALMKERKLDFFLATSSDPHMSEYVGDHFKVTEYLSGCTSDNVTLIIGLADAWLWTDGRYFISAARELSGSGIRLMKMGEKGVPTVPAFLAEQLAEGMTLGADTRTISASSGYLYADLARRHGAALADAGDLIDPVWPDRPALSCHPLWVLSDEASGRSAEDKLREVRSEMKKAGAASLVLSKLDDLMYLTNLRGGDVPCNPVALSFGVITEDAFHFFVQKAERTEASDTALAKSGITPHDYETFFDFLRETALPGPVMLDAASVSYAIWNLVLAHAKILNRTSPTVHMKAVKNATERARSKEAYLLDSVAVCRFLFYIKHRIGKETITETSAAAYLDGLRAQIPGYLDLSFPTISAYNENAAMAHYAPSEAHPVTLQPEGFLLVDSGGQYMGGTTDVTRTIALGDLTDEMKRDFTLVAISNLALMNARFPFGATGRNLDTFARAPLWERGIDFNHGTGHGIGYILNVHEGPQNISWKLVRTRPEAVFEDGMITSDEPGIYREGKYGIRTESIMLCVKDETETEFGQFLHFEPLTFAPIDLDAIEPSYLSAIDRQRLNAYHALVYEKISPFLKGEELTWLKDATRAI